MMRLSEIATLFNAPMRGADVVFTSVGICLLYTSDAADD